MPGLDRTGPEGQGSQTGRRLGKCDPENRIDQVENKEDNTRLASKGKSGNERNAEDYFVGGRGRGPRGRGKSSSGRGRGPAGRGGRFRGGQ